MTETMNIREAGGRSYIPNGPEVADKASGADSIGGRTLSLYRVSWKASALEGKVIRDRLNGGTETLPAYAGVNRDPAPFVTGYGEEDASRKLGSIYTGGAPFPQYVDLERLGTVVDDARKAIVK